MKKLVKCIMVAFCLAVAVAFAAGVQTTNVQAKKKVTYKLKKGTLTIKGKGNMPKKIKVKKSKVKKIVIKKGVKNISNNAFKNFKKVKKIVEMHNANIRVISEEGKGSEFKIYFKK